MALPAFASSAFAQRGELRDESESATDREASQLDGFPGTFNAAMQAPGEWRLDVGLSPSISYGLHEDATLRTSLLPLAGLGRGSPSIGGELRYRLWHDSEWAVVGTFGGMITRFDIPAEDRMGDDTIDIRAAYASVSGEWRIGPRRAVALTVLAGGVKFSSRTRVDDSQMAEVEGGLALQGIGVMASYSLFPFQWFGFDVGLGIAPRIEAQLQGTGGSQSVDLDSLSKAAHGVGGRFTLYAKPGRTWLIYLGTVILPPTIPVPAFGVAKRW